MALTSGYIAGVNGWDAASVKSQMDLRGADGIYLLHNHPSGKVDPSNEDLKLTRSFGKEFEDALKGHVVINSDKFALIDRYGATEKIKYNPKAGLLFSNRIKIKGTDSTAEVADQLLKRDNIDGAIIYIQSDLSISAYDPIHKGQDHQETIKRLKRDLEII